MKLILSERPPASIQVQPETIPGPREWPLSQHSHLCPCRYLWGLLGVTGGAYAGTAALAGILFYFFNSTSQDCSFNVTIIVGTVVLGLVMSAISVSSLVGAQLEGCWFFDFI